MLERWWRDAARAPENLAELPTRDAACRIAFEPADEGATRRSVPGSPAEEGRTAGLAENAWWTFWKPFVFYALAPDFAPGGAGSSPGPQFAVIVAGAPLRLPGLAQRHGAFPGDAHHWLEDVHPGLEATNPNPAAPECPQDASRVACSADDCLRVSVAPARADFNDVVAAAP
jgi:hypothetical protein